MSKLGGFAVSNYYNKVKVALLKKGVSSGSDYKSEQSENYNQLNLFLF